MSLVKVTGMYNFATTKKREGGAKVPTPMLRIKISEHLS